MENNPLHFSHSPHFRNKQSPSPLASPAHTNMTTVNTPASTPKPNLMSMPNTIPSTSMGKLNPKDSMSRSILNLNPSTSLDSSGLDMDESQSPNDGSRTKGKCDKVKQEPDVKSEMDDDSMMDTNSNSNCGGKNANNDMKSEIKAEPMDQGEGHDNDLDDMNDTKDDIKDEPMSPSDDKPIIEKRSSVPEPIEQDGADKDAKKKCVYDAVELRKALIPTWEKMYTNSESVPFQQPVDPSTLNIPDYFEIIKQPMDLSTIHNKLTQGKYTDPWQYVDDVWLMFDNAWLYNRKTSRVYKSCTKLSEIFEQCIDPVMQSLGYCCGRKYTFNPQVLCCFGKQLCTIPRDAKYYSYSSSQNYTGSYMSNRYTFCQKCFNDIPGDMVTLGDDPLQTR